MFCDQLTFLMYACVQDQGVICNHTIGEFCTDLKHVGAVWIDRCEFTEACVSKQEPAADRVSPLSILMAQQC